MEREIGLAALADIGTLALSSSAEAIEAMCDLAQRLSGVDITVVSEVTPDGRYVFRGLETREPTPLERDTDIPWEWSLCSRVHAGESPAVVPETRDVPALWASWLRLKERLGVDWDVRAFCTRDVRLPDGSFFGTVCLHHTEPRLQVRAKELAECPIVVDQEDGRHPRILLRIELEHSVR